TDAVGGGPAHRRSAGPAPARPDAAGYGGHPGQRAGLSGGRLDPHRDPALQPDPGSGGGGRTGPGPAGPDGSKPAPPSGGPGGPGQPAGAAAVDLAQPDGSLRQLPVWIFSAVCAGAAAPQKGPSHGGPERHADALGAPDGPGPRPRPRQP